MGWRISWGKRAGAKICAENKRNARIRDRTIKEEVQGEIMLNTKDHSNGETEQ